MEMGEPDRRLSCVMRAYSLILVLLVTLPLWSRDGHGVLYEISGNSAKAKSYILATNRLTDITYLDSIPDLWKAWGRCNKVVTEFAMEDYEALAVLRQAALLPDSIRLKNFYTEAEYQEIDETLKLQIGMGLSELGRMKPANLTEMLRTELMRKWLDYDEARSMETFFEQVAQEQDKPVYGLDNIGETMYMLFDREPFHFQCEELKNCVEYPERELQLERELYRLYHGGFLNDMVYSVCRPDNQSTLSYSDYQVYAARNHTWAARLQPYFREGGAFVTLNALFLGGDKGLLAELKAAGYRVKAL